MLITMFSFMGEKLSPLPPRIRHAGKTYCPRYQLGYLAYFYLLFVLYFCRSGVNTVEYAGAESRWFLSLGSGIAEIPHAKLIMDCVILLSVTSSSELGAVYRVKDALLLKPSR